MNIKCALAGDGAAGKTFLLRTYVDNSCPEDCIHEVFDNKTISVTVDNIEVVLQLWDTSGLDEYAGLRVFSYNGADVFLLCFDLSNKSSVSSIKTKWYPELVHHGPMVPIVLVGTKLDIRQDKENNSHSKQLVSRSEGERMARRIKAVKYVECSARTQEGLKAVFEEAVRAVLSKRDGHSRQICTVQ